MRINEARDEPAFMVLASSRAARRRVRPLAWAVLEELVLCAHIDDEGLVASASVRSVAAAIGVGKDASAKALTRLAELGLIRHETHRHAGRYAGSFYRFDLDACRQAGLLLTTPARDGIRPETPCPGERDAARPDPAAPDTSSADMAGGAKPRSPHDRHHPHVASQASLFADAGRGTRTPEPTTPNRNPTYSSTLTNPKPDPSTPSLHADTTPFSSSLTPSNRPDALAPEVRQGLVNVAGNEVGAGSALNGNLNGEARPC